MCLPCQQRNADRWGDSTLEAELVPLLMAALQTRTAGFSFGPLEHPPFAAAGKLLARELLHAGAEILQHLLHADGGAEFQQLLWQSTGQAQRYRAWFHLHAGGWCLPNLLLCLSSWLCSHGQLNGVINYFQGLLDARVASEHGSSLAHVAQELGKANSKELLLS